MITLLHGDDIEGSRNVLNSLKKSAKVGEVRQLNGKSLDESTLTQALESRSFFGGDSLVVIENLLSTLGRKTKSIEGFTDILRKNEKQTDVILWEGKEITPGIVKNLGPSVQVKLFKLPVVIFQFLDGIRPGNTKTVLGLSQQLLQTVPAEVVFVMIVRRLRQLIMLRDNVAPEGLQGWQIGRLTSQAKSFTMEKLVTMYKKLLDTEVSIKTGASPFTLSQLLEQFIIDYTS